MTKNMRTVSVEVAKYPTKEEILAEKPLLKTEDIRYIQEWKRTIWRTARSIPKSMQQKVKASAIVELLHGLANLHQQPVNVELVPNLKTPHYEFKSKTIRLPTNPSVITALHEIAHHFFGESELTACRWSIHTFQRCFPKAFKKLEWSGHMLKKKSAAKKK